MGQIDDCIAQCDNALSISDHKFAAGIVSQILSVYSGQISNIEVGLSRYGQMRQGEEYPDDVDHLGDVIKLRGKLVAQKEQWERESNVREAPVPPISINQSVNNSITVNVSLTQTIQELSEIDDAVLNAEDKNELILLMTELESCKGDKKAEGKAAGLVKTVIDKVVDKGLDAMLAVLPQALVVFQSMA